MLGGLISAPALAQIPNQVPGGPLTAAPTAPPLPRVLPPTAPNVGPGLSVPVPQPLTAPLSGAQVQVSSAELRGSTAYPPNRFADLLGSLHGTVDQSRVEQVRAEIVQAYRADGYVFTAVSATLEPGGRLVFSATEGRIIEVKLDGDIGPAGVQVLRFLNHLTEASPIDVNTLERWLLLAQDVPGITLRTVLRPSVGDPGALSLVAQVSRQKFSGLATADNRGYSGTGPEQFVTSISANSFTEFGERTDATLFYTARSTELFGQLSTELFLGASGLKLRVYGGRGTTDPTGSLGQIGYHGDTEILGASLSYPIIRRRQESLAVSAYFDMLEGSVSTLGSVAGTTTLSSRDDLRVLRVGLDYALRDTALGDTRSAVTVASTRLSHGLNVLGSSPQGDRLAGRVNERIDFTKISAEASRTQTVINFSDTTSLALQALVAGQYTEDVLPSAETFYLGGLRYDRGFYSGQVTGDRAITTAYEVQLNTRFSPPGLNGPFDLGAQFYGFYDYGETWQSQKADRNARLVSSGGGVRLYFPRAIELDVEGVGRITRRPLGASGNISALPDTAVYWRVISRF